MTSFPLKTSSFSMQYLLPKIRILFLFLCLTNTPAYVQHLPPHIERAKLEKKVVNEKEKVGKEKKFVKQPELIKFEDYQTKTLEEIKKLHPDKNLIFEEPESKSKIAYNFKTHEIEIGENVVINADLNKEYKIEDIFKFADHPYNKSAIHTASIIDPISDAPIVRALKASAEKNKMQHALLDRANMKSVIRSAHGGILFITGHYDVGSSRVDLQACKLEYSIVSPK